MGDTLEEGDVCSRCSRGLQPRDGLVEAVFCSASVLAIITMSRVEPVTRQHGSPDPLHEHLRIHYLLSTKVTAALRLDLIFDMQPRHAASVVLLDRARDVVRTSVARVCICDQRDCWVEICNHLGVLPHIVQRREGQVGLAELRGTGTSAGLSRTQVSRLQVCGEGNGAKSGYHVQAIKTNFDSYSCAEAIVHARQENKIVSLLKLSPQFRRGRGCLVAVTVSAISVAGDHFQKR